MEPDHVFAVDGGGSKTVATLRDRHGRTLGTGRGGPCNLYRDAGAAMAAIAEAWAQCCREAGLEPLAAAARTTLSAALAGVGAAPGRARFFAASSQFARADLSSDAYAALAAAEADGPAVLLSIGTGTVACRFQGERFIRIGGWGFPAGDGGGGAWLGLQLVSAWLRHLDGVQPGDGSDADLWHDVGTTIGTGRDAVLGWLRAAGPAEYGSLAPAVLRGAAAGSATASSLLDAAATQCAALVRALWTGRESIALAGGLAPALAPRLRAALTAEILPGTADPLEGAWLVAIGRYAPEYRPDYTPGSAAEPARCA